MCFSATALKDSVDGHGFDIELALSDEDRARDHSIDGLEKGECAFCELEGRGVPWKSEIVDPVCLADADIA